MNITMNNLEQIVKENKCVIIDFWANWCNPCKALGPIIEGVAKNYPDVFFGKVNVDEEEELAIGFKISSIPCVVKIVDGKIVDKFVGLHDEAFVDAFFNK